MAAIILIVINVLTIVTMKEAKGDKFSASAELVDLIELERKAVESLERYIRYEMRRLNELKQLSRGSMEMVGNYVENLDHPIASFSHMNRWLKSPMIKRMQKNSAQEILEDLSHLLPSRDDLDGAAIGLLRLQDTYDLRAQDMAAGYIAPGIVSKLKFTADDAFKIARIATAEENLSGALEWSQLALNLLNKEEDVTVESRTAYLDFLAWALFKTGNIQRAHLTAQNIIRIDPLNERGQDLLQFFEGRIHGEGRRVPRNSSDVPPVHNPKSFRKELGQYERICRGQYQSSNTSLNCFHKMDSPFLRLAPLKVEVLSQDPAVLLFKGLLSNQESKTLKEVAKPKLERALVIDRSVGHEVPASFRIAKNAWFKDRENPVVRRVSRRFEQMTGLSMTTAELLQIANYGIGGQYEPHFDMSTRGIQNPYSDKNGNRMATILAYLEEPLAGGGTAFGELDLLIPPIKNDAVLWYNVFPDGTADTRMKHAGCPVLGGFKWVANKWIKERGQEFLRPCLLTPQSHKFR